MFSKYRLFPLTAVAVLLYTSSIATSTENTLTRETIDSVIEQAQEQQKDLPEPMKPTKEVEDAVKDIQKTITSKEFKNRVEQYRGTLRHMILENPSLTQPETAKNDDPFKPGPALSQTERVYIFISSSMPKSTLRQYAMALDRIKDPNITMVMRGFVGGMKLFRPTYRFTQDILIKDEGCTGQAGQKCDAYNAMIQIDPMLFTRYDITSVPAIAYADNVNILEPDSSEGLSDKVNVGNSLVIHGDISLEYALQEFHRETKKESLRLALDALRKGYYK